MHSLTTPLPRRARAAAFSKLVVAAATLALVASSVLAVAIASDAAAASGVQYVVAPSGSDSAAGTATAPFKTFTHALKQLRPGDTLLARGGTYPERVKMSSTAITPGRADAPITVQAYPGERPVIQGLLWLTAPDHWTVRGINVTWSSANASNEHMVKFQGGTGWRYTASEVWGAKSYAGILVTGGATKFRLDHLYVHDTHPTNSTNQDHLIYVSTGNRGGIIERSVLANSPNGRGVKVGPGSLTQPGTNDLVIRYNTFSNNTGPSNVRFSGDSTNNTVYGNLMVRPASGLAAVTAYELTGTGNTARDNAVWDASGAVKTTSGLSDGGGNTTIDPRFADPAKGDYRPTNPAATNYGAHAPGDQASPAAPAPAPSPAPAPAPAPGGDSPITAPATREPIEAFVSAVVHDFLGRTATPAEIDTWRRRLGAGAPRREATNSFAYSQEWIGVLVDGYYQSTLRRAPDPAGRTGWIETIKRGTAPALVASSFYGSEEYFRQAGGTDDAWVRDLYEEILGRAADAPGLRHWSELARSGTARTTIAHHFYQSLESRRRRVGALYQSLLARAPDAGGLAHWTDVLADGRDVDLATFLAASTEYFQRAQRRSA